MNKIMNSLIEISQSRVDFEQKKFQNKQDIELLDPKHNGIIDNIKQKGYFVVEDFYSIDECKLLRDEVDRVISLKQDDSSFWTDSCTADKRVFGAEINSKLINKFHENKFLLDVAQNYFGSTVFNSNTLAGRIEAKEGNVGSGEGWHRDSHHFQFKAIVYLSDVTLDNGPFQIIESSHRSGNVLRNTVTMKVDSMTTRYTDEQIQKVIDEDTTKYKVFTAKAGTLIFADTSALHTGMPLKRGDRYALFNYYHPSFYDKKSMLNHFGL